MSPHPACRETPAAPPPPPSCPLNLDTDAWRDTMCPVNVSHRHHGVQRPESTFWKFIANKLSLSFSLS